MKEGRPSETAILVCMGRALAHGRTSVARYSDPTALPLLPADAQARVERARTPTPPRGFRPRIDYELLRAQADMMAPRTVVIDDAVRDARAPQLVVLGAGLDGRAWRMPELADAVVFEVDHPASQGLKRERVAALTPVCRDIRFVAIDFTRDSLDDKLAEAGHDPQRPTMWIWEGVVMYLTPADVEASLAVIARRSAAGSRVAIMYHSRVATRFVASLLVRALGEPLRSAYTEPQMRALLARYGFHSLSDRNFMEIGAAEGVDVSRLKRFTHGRIVVAERG